MDKVRSVSKVGEIEIVTVGIISNKSHYYDNDWVRNLTQDVSCRPFSGRHLSCEIKAVYSIVNGVCFLQMQLTLSINSRLKVCTILCTI